MITPLSIEETKRIAAREAVKQHYPANAKYVGIGSGTTIVYVVDSIKELGFDTSSTLFVPTGSGSRKLIENAGLTPIAFDMLPEGTVLDVAFDGADEVDDELNCIKGGGACLFQEKIVARQAKEFICVADYRKLQPRLLTKWFYIPIEVAPIARFRVLTALEKLGSTRPALRNACTTSQTTGAKEFVPLKTDQDFYLIDAPFKTLVTSADVKAGKVDGDGKGKDGVWEVEALCKEIKAIEGVLDVGLFTGLTGRQTIEKGLECGGAKPVAAYFGMTDGSVTVRKA
ncbi:ribose-5-phosphate isomerase rki1 [Ascosphaera aggregata]|nr:ribose-5-phosphate isomerase rki1 [Ascosphaera aggregata]